MTTSSLHVNIVQLMQAWQSTLPNYLNASDKCEVKADARNSQALRIHIQTEGRSDYSFDFLCTYVDSREVRVELIDAEQGGRTIAEEHETVQGLIKDYVRHIHECAQELKSITND